MASRCELNWQSGTTYTYILVIYSYIEASVRFILIAFRIGSM